VNAIYKHSSVPLNSVKMPKMQNCEKILDKRDELFWRTIFDIYVDNQQRPRLIYTFLISQYLWHFMSFARVYTLSALYTLYKLYGVLIDYDTCNRAHRWWNNFSFFFERFFFKCFSFFRIIDEVITAMIETQNRF